jgi:hypothetical protein
VVGEDRVTPYEPRYFATLREKHPYPGGWADLKAEPSRERLAAWQDLVRKYRKWKPRKPNWPGANWRWSGMAPDNEVGSSILGLGRAPEDDKPIYYFEGDRLFAVRHWIDTHIVRGWNKGQSSSFFYSRGVPRRPFSHGMHYYDVIAAIEAVVLSKTHGVKRLRPSVTSLTQGSRSIEQSMRDFVAALK